MRRLLGLLLAAFLFAAAIPPVSAAARHHSSRKHKVRKAKKNPKAKWGAQRRH